MNWKISICMSVFCLNFYSFDLPVSTRKLTENYIAAYKRIAVEEMRRTGIPASIKLAQGILESDLGRSPLAVSANNHFGIKCGSSWTGMKFYKHDDDKDSSGQLIESCFRSYMNPEESYRAHSEFLTAPDKQGRYGFLFRLGTTDYQGWANGLKFSGYASDPAYPQKLVRIIESYQLHLLDESVARVEVVSAAAENKVTPSPGNPKETKEDTNHTVTSRITTKEKPLGESRPTLRKYVVTVVNGSKYVKAAGGESLNVLAASTGQNVLRLMEYNEGLFATGQVLDKDEIVFLDRKKKTFDAGATHQVKAGETLYSISQMYGLRLSTLSARNNLPENADPLPGEVINLGKNLPSGKMPRHTRMQEEDRFIEFGSRL